MASPMMRRKAVPILLFGISLLDDGTGNVEGLKPKVFIKTALNGGIYTIMKETVPGEVRVYNIEELECAFNLQASYHFNSVVC